MLPEVLTPHVLRPRYRNPLPRPIPLQYVPSEPGVYFTCDQHAETRHGVALLTVRRVCRWLWRIGCLLYWLSSLPARRTHISQCFSARCARSGSALTACGWTNSCCSSAACCGSCSVACMMLLGRLLDINRVDCLEEQFRDLLYCNALESEVPQCEACPAKCWLPPQDCNLHLTDDTLAGRPKGSVSSHIRAEIAAALTLHSVHVAGQWLRLRGTATS